METTALAVTNQMHEITSGVWGTIEKMAPVMQKSRLFGVATAEQAMAIMAKGYELGLPLTGSFQYIHVIQDKPSLSPQGALALIYRSPDFVGIQINDVRDAKGEPVECKVTMKRKNGVEYTASYSMADAKNADLIKTGSGWAKYPANMLRWRAIGYCADIVFPDVTGGMKRADEYGADITIDGQVIVVDNPQTTVKKKDTGAMLQELLNTYSPIDILAANNNVLPSTIEEIESIKEKLGAVNG